MNEREVASIISVFSDHILEHSHMELLKHTFQEAAIEVLILPETWSGSLYEPSHHVKRTETNSMFLKLDWVNGCTMFAEDVDHI